MPTFKILALLGRDSIWVVKTQIYDKNIGSLLTVLSSIAVQMEESTLGINVKTSAHPAMWSHDWYLSTVSTATH